MSRCMALGDCEGFSSGYYSSGCTSSKVCKVSRILIFDLHTSISPDNMLLEIILGLWKYGIVRITAVLYQSSTTGPRKLLMRGTSTNARCCRNSSTLHMSLANEKATTFREYLCLSRTWARINMTSRDTSLHLAYTYKGRCNHCPRPISTELEIEKQVPRTTTARHG